MSDIEEGPGWWLGVDGKWYPPVAHAAPAGDLGALPPPPGDQSAPVVPSMESDGDAFDGVEEHPPDAPARKRAPWVLLSIIAVVVVVVGVAGTVAAFMIFGGAEAHTISGTMTLRSTSISFSGGACAGSGGYSDIRSGADVKVKDGEGKIIATSSLSPGISGTGSCTFVFVAKDVPASDFYAIEVSHRGELTFSRAEMKEQHWLVSSTLGNGK